jgi:hypothetical protein
MIDEVVPSVEVECIVAHEPPLGYITIIVHSSNITSKLVCSSSVL